MICALNMKNEPVTIWSDFPSSIMEDLISGNTYTLENGLTIPAETCLFLAVKK